MHQQRFGRPGASLLGADSHTPAAGSLGALAIGAGGLAIALALAGIDLATVAAALPAGLFREVLVVHGDLAWRRGAFGRGRDLSLLRSRCRAVGASTLWLAVPGRDLRIYQLSSGAAGPQQ